MLSEALNDLAYIHSIQAGSFILLVVHDGAKVFAT